jgi:hypothetical protein
MCTERVEIGKRHTKPLRCHCGRHVASIWNARGAAHESCLSVPIAVNGASLLGLLPPRQHSPPRSADRMAPQSSGRIPLLTSDDSRERRASFKDLSYILPGITFIHGVSSGCTLENNRSRRHRYSWCLRLCCLSSAEPWQQLSGHWKFL